MKNKQLLYIILIATAAVGVWYFLKKKQKPAPSTGTREYQAYSQGTTEQSTNARGTSEVGTAQGKGKKKQGGSTPSVPAPGGKVIIPAYSFQERDKKPSLR